MQSYILIQVTHTVCNDSSTSLHPFHASSLSRLLLTILSQQNDWNLKPCGITLPANWGNLHFPQSTKCLPILQWQRSKASLWFYEERERSVTYPLNFFFFETRPFKKKKKKKTNTRSNLVQLVMRPTLTYKKNNNAIDHSQKPFDFHQHSSYSQVQHVFIHTWVTDCK